MINESTCNPTLIEAGRAIRLVDGVGTDVTSIDGTLWITQEGDPRDVILNSGESFRVDRSGLTLVVALEQPALAQIMASGDRATFDLLAVAGVVGKRPCNPEPNVRELVAGY